MRLLVYGCSQRIKDILEKIAVYMEKFDFADSNPEKWNTEIITNKKIIAPDSIEVKKYDFCVVGSEKYGEEIWQRCISIGFSESAMIPASFIVSQYERWNKIYFYDEWKTSVEKKGIRVIKNWYTQKDNLECVIEIENCLWNDFVISFMCFSADRLDICIQNMITDEVIRYSGVCGEKMTYRIKSDKELIKLQIENSMFDVPWFGFDISASALHDSLYKQKRAELFTDAFNMMTAFYFHDEDYLAVKGFCNKGTIIDLGANYGQSMYAFYHLTNSRIVAVEAVPELYDILQIFKESFDTENRIDIINAAIAEEAGELTWYDPGPLLCGSFDKDFLYSVGVRVELKQKNLRCDSLDNILAQFDDVWLMKMDVEGLEYKALLGGCNFIERNFPIMCIEENQYRIDIMRLLEDYYELYYFAPFERKFIRNDVLGVNYWLIPKKEYRSDRVKAFLQELLFE